MPPDTPQKRHGWIGWLGLAALVAIALAIWWFR